MRQLELSDKLLVLAAALIAVVGILLVIYESAQQLAPSPLPTSQPTQQTFLATKPVVTPSASAPPTKFVRLAWFYKPPDASQMDLVAKNFDLFILTYKDEQERNMLKSQGVKVPFSQYLLLMTINDPGDCQKNPSGNQVAYKPGDFCEISQQHPDWFLLDQKGNRIKSQSNSYYMDPGSEGYRQFWLERARELQETNGWDNIFLDNVEASRAKLLEDGETLPKYPDDKSFQQAVEGFLSYIRQNYFQPRGKMMYGNIVSVDDDQVWGNYLKFLDGAMIESFATDWSNGYRSPDEWEQQMEEAEAALSAGKTMILVSQGDQNNEKLQNFTFASYLLIDNGNAFFRYTNSKNYRDVWMYDNYNIDLGKPLGSRYKDQGGWRRDFSNGYVTVNPQKQTAEIVVNQ